MNFKKTVLSSFAIVALSLSMAAPVALAADTEQDLRNAQASVTEGGSMNFGTWQGVTFGSVTVTTTKGAETSEQPQLLEVNDSHSSSFGYTLQLSADDLIEADGNYVIDNDNLLVRRSGFVAHSSCLGGAAKPVVGGNGYQKTTIGLGNAQTSLETPVTLVSADAGRGCGLFHLGYMYQLDVPAGTYTGGGTAVYNADLTISNVAEVGDPQE
jgi:hypothetical protein